MQRSNMPAPLVVCVAVVCVAGGCASHVEWRKDSQGFYFSKPGGAIAEYDLATEKTRNVTRIDMGDTEDGFAGFDLRPDGERLVVTESFTLGNDTRQVRTELRILRLDGTQERSATLEWMAADDPIDERKPVPTFVEFSPTGDHVLLTTSTAIAVWSVETGKFQPHEQVRPLLPLYLGASPWRPDGEVLLAIGGEKGMDDLMLVGLDARVLPIDAGDSLQEGMAKNVFPSGTWQEDVLVTDLGERMLTIDTNSRTAKAEAHEPTSVREFPVGEARLRFEAKTVDGAEVVRVEWIKGDQTVPIADSLGPTFTLPAPIVRSPDGKRAVVVREKELVIVDDTGIVGRIALER